MDFLSFFFFSLPEIRVHILYNKDWRSVRRNTILCCLSAFFSILFLKMKVQKFISFEMLSAVGKDALVDRFATKFPFLPRLRVNYLNGVVVELKHIILLII